jgi:sensor histidine kinase YesM
MKQIIVGLLLVISVSVYSATQDADGNLLLSQEEVYRTIEQFNQLEIRINYSNSKIKELQDKLEKLEKVKCV